MIESYINITVESRLSGPSSGYLLVNTRLDETPVNLIVAFCGDKGLRSPGKYVLRTANDLLLDNNRPLSDYGLADGDVVYLTNRNFSDSPLGFCNWMAMGFLCLVIGVVGLVAVFMIYDMTGDIPNDYGIVFDAGSTHTSMMLYRWSGAKLNDTGTPEQVHKCEMQGGGISMFVGQEDQLADVLNSCLNEAKSHIPGGRVGTTPVFLGATGGMRILQIKDENAAKKLLDTVGQTFSKSGFLYQSENVGTISGYTEGADAWVTSNYLSNTIVPGRRNVSFTIGTLDLGGASTQWAYQVPEVGNVNMELYGLPHSILTNSSLCFGRFQSLIRHTAQLTVGLTDAKQTVTDACLPRGSSIQISLKDIFESPCANMDVSLRPKLPDSTNITFVGSSSSANCSKQVASLFNESECSNYYKYDYCFMPQNLSDTLMPYLAISGFYDLMSSLNLTDTPSTQEQFNAAVTAECQKSGNVTSTKSLCYLGHYVNQLLTTGYSFNNETWTNLNFANSLNNTELGWTLGLMINVTNSIAAELPREPFTQTVFALLVVLFCFFILLSLAFAVHAWKSTRQPNEYQRLSQYGAI